MTRGGRAGSTRGRGRGALDTPPLVEPIVAPLPTVVSPPVQSSASISSLADLPIPSPSNSTAPPTSSSVAGSSIEILQVDESIEAQVRKAFLAQASLHYADMLSKFKNKWTSTGRPACVAEETWAIWEAYWDRPDVKAKSEQQRKNRMSEREELQKEPNLFECFAQMHKKKDGMFVDERLKRIAEEIQARHDIATQEAEDSTKSPNINMSQFPGSSANSQLHQDAMKDMMNQQLETMRADMKAKLQAEMDAKLQA
nr:uncharacterized protein LOC109149905 [Ipomoea batatas]